MPQLAGGEISRLIAERDWSDSPLGPPETWPIELRDAVRLMLPTRAQIVLFWGPDYVALYNDAYAPTIGDKHPRALGRPAGENWAELWDDLEPLLRGVRDTGETYSARDRAFYMERRGYGEEVFFDISFSAVRGESGHIAGVLCIVAETTKRVLSERRLQFQVALADRLRTLSEPEEVKAEASRLLGERLGVDHAGYAEIDETETHYILGRDWTAPGVKSLTGVLPIAAFGPGVIESFHAGRTVIIDDTASDEVTEGFREAYAAAGVAANIATPLIKDGRCVAVLHVHSSKPRWWSETDILLVEETAARTWAAVEQAKAEDALRESEDLLREATEAADIGTWDYDPTTGELRWDARCKELFGLPADAETTLDETFFEGLHPDDRQMAADAMGRAVDPAVRERFDVEYRTIGFRDGIERWVSAKGRAVFEAEQPVRFIGTVIDISARRRNEAALAVSERALREQSRTLEVLNATMTKVAAEFDLDTLVQTVVDAGVELTGAQFGAFFYNVIDSRGERYTLYAISGVDRSEFDKFPMPRNTKVFAPTFAGEAIVRSDDIRQDPRYGLSAPHHGQPKGHLPVRSYLAAPVMARSGEVFGGLFFGHPEPGRFPEKTESLAEGLAAQAAIGIENVRLFQAAQRLNQTLEADVAARTAERDRIWRVSGDLLGVSDMGGVWKSVNPAWTRVLGWTAEEIVGRTSEWLEHPDDQARTRAEVAHLAEGEVTHAFENRFRAKDGGYRTLSWTAVPVEGSIYAIARDVTVELERRAELAEMQERLRQSQKMETVGQLTGGVAHDFNNLLQIVTGNLDILLRTLPEEAARQRRAADSAMSGAKRAATLTQRLLAFSRRQPLAPKPLNPNKLVGGMSDLLHRTLGETVQIEVVSSPNLWRVEADPNELENALLNLALNARDAMPGGGKLTIETANTHFDPSYVAQHPELSAGQYVAISVSDTGVGMAPDVIERVFEPFFTTKDVGKGTGLGLSMVYGFVKQSGGHVKVYSEVGQGTTVRIYLPRLQGAAAEDEDAAVAPPLERAGDETILVCEDDEDVRAYSVEVLRELGYRVLEAPDGPTALRVLERQEDGVDLLFTDVVLPSGMTGAVLADRARALRPGLKVLFTTGYARNAIVHHGRLDPGVELITKPFAYADLAVKIRDILDA